MWHWCWHKLRLLQWLKADIECCLSGVLHLFQRRVRQTQWGYWPCVRLGWVWAGEESGQDECLSSGDRKGCVSTSEPRIKRNPERNHVSLMLTYIRLKNWIFYNILSFHCYFKYQVLPLLNNHLLCLYVVLLTNVVNLIWCSFRRRGSGHQYHRNGCRCWSGTGKTRNLCQDNHWRRSNTEGRKVHFNISWISEITGESVWLN